MKLIICALAAGMVFIQSSQASSFGVDMVIGSGGMWGTTNDNTGETAGKDSYFNTAKASVYYHIGKIKGNIGVPLALTFENFGDSLRYAFYPGDASLYWGIGLGPVEPRVGISIPLGYPTEGVAWIGSNNLKGIVGIGYRIGSFANDKISLGGEAMGRINITGLRQGARIDQGSLGGYATLKASYKIAPKFTVGLEAFPHASYFTKTDWGTQQSPSIGFLPIASLGFSPSPRVELSAKGGYGLGKSGEKLESTQNIIYGVISVLIYTW